MVWHLRSCVYLSDPSTPAHCEQTALRRFALLARALISANWHRNDVPTWLLGAKKAVL